MKGQMNLEFILSTSLFLVVLIFSLITINNVFPNIHKESAYDSLRARGYMVSQQLIYDSGQWNGPEIRSTSRMGLTIGIPYLLDYEKISAIDRCDDDDYEKMKLLFGLMPNENFIINISRVSFSGSSDIPMTICMSRSFASNYAKFWSRRYSALAGYPNNIIRVDVSVY